MHRTVEAIIHPDGTVEVLESVASSASRRALLTILEELPLGGAAELIGDDEDARVEAILRAAAVFMVPEEIPADLEPLTEEKLDALWEHIPPGTPLSQAVIEDREERF